MFVDLVFGWSLWVRRSPKRGSVFVDHGEELWYHVGTGEELGVVGEDEVRGCHLSGGDTYK